jgi:hypothetical protein
MHFLDAWSWFKVKSSCIETDSLSDQCMILISARIAVVGQIDKDWLVETGSSDGMHQSEPLVDKFISPNHSEGNFISKLLLSGFVNSLSLF